MTGDALAQRLRDLTAERYAPVPRRDQATIDAALATPAARRKALEAALTGEEDAA